MLKHTTRTPNSGNSHCGRATQLSYLLHISNPASLNAENL